MGFSGGIYVLNNADFRLDISQFKEALYQQWPEVQIHDPPTSPGDIDFGMTIAGEFESLAGSTIDQEQIGWWGTVEALAEFSVWFRRYISAESAMLISFGDETTQYLVTPSTSEQEIIDSLDADSYFFEIVFESKKQLFTVIPEALKSAWEGTYVSTDTRDNHYHWLLRSLDGHTDLDTTTIYFSESNLHFASRFAVWCRQLVDTDLRLAAKSLPDSESALDIALTSVITEQEIWEQLKLALDEE